MLRPIEESPMFERFIVGSLDVPPSLTTSTLLRTDSSSDSDSLYKTRQAHIYENGKGALKENEEQSNLLYK